ncbi:hypothetical protein HDU96_009699 [Phlyctochytrium bullatum]|nr:hypothetical protein HDU96_009699 [Phlyctochytrium bullatum]
MDLTGNKLILALAGRKVLAYDIRNMENIFEKGTSMKFMTRTLRCMPNGQGYAVSSIEGRVAVEFFEAADQGKKYAFKCHREKTAEGGEVFYPVHALAFHPTHGTFASGGGDGVVNLWDGHNKKRLKQYPKYPTSISALAFSPDGKTLAIASSYAYEDGEKDKATTETARTPQPTHSNWRTLLNSSTPITPLPSPSQPRKAASLSSVAAEGSLGIFDIEARQDSNSDHECLWEKTDLGFDQRQDLEPPSRSFHDRLRSEGLSVKAQATDHRPEEEEVYVIVPIPGMAKSSTKRCAIPKSQVIDAGENIIIPKSVLKNVPMSENIKKQNVCILKSATSEVVTATTVGRDFELVPIPGLSEDSTLRMKVPKVIAQKPSIVAPSEPVKRRRPSASRPGKKTSQSPSFSHQASFPPYPAFTTNMPAFEEKDEEKPLGSLSARKRKERTVKLALEEAVEALTQKKEEERARRREEEAFRQGSLGAYHAELKRLVDSKPPGPIPPSLLPPPQSVLPPTIPTSLPLRPPPSLLPTASNTSAVDIKAVPTKRRQPSVTELLPLGSSSSWYPDDLLSHNPSVPAWLQHTTSVVDLVKTDDSDAVAPLDAAAASARNLVSLLEATQAAPTTSLIEDVAAKAAATAAAFPLTLPGGTHNALDRPTSVDSLSTTNDEFLASDAESVLTAPEEPTAEPKSGLDMLLIAAQYESAGGILGAVGVDTDDPTLKSLQNAGPEVHEVFSTLARAAEEFEKRHSNRVPERGHFWEKDRFPVVEGRSSVEALKEAHLRVIRPHLVSMSSENAVIPRDRNLRKHFILRRLGMINEMLALQGQRESALASRPRMRLAPSCSDSSDSDGSSDVPLATVVGPKAKRAYELERSSRFLNSAGHVDEVLASKDALKGGSLSGLTGYPAVSAATTPLLAALEEVKLPAAGFAGVGTMAHNSAVGFEDPSGRSPSPTPSLPSSPKSRGSTMRMSPSPGQGGSKRLDQATVASKGLLPDTVGVSRVFGAKRHFGQLRPSKSFDL